MLAVSTSSHITSSHLHRYGRIDSQASNHSRVYLELDIFGSRHNRSPLHHDLVLKYGCNQLELSDPCSEGILFGAGCDHLWTQ